MTRADIAESSGYCLDQAQAALRETDMAVADKATISRVWIDMAHAWVSLLQARCPSCGSNLVES